MHVTDKLPFKLSTLQSAYGDMNPGWMVEFPTSFNKKMVSFDIVQGSAAIAFIAILETLISAKIADGMTKTKHDPHKEVLGLAIANVVSGIVGGIPATAALARYLCLSSSLPQYLRNNVERLLTFAVEVHRTYPPQLIPLPFS